MASADLSSSPVPDGDRGSSGEFALKKLFAEFAAVGDRKLRQSCSQPLDYPLAKGLVRGEDAQFDQILSALSEVSSFCLQSLLTSIFKWRDMQIEQCRSITDQTAIPSSDNSDSPFPSSKKERAYFVERKELAVEFLFCLVLVEVMPRLSVHPVPESFIHNIEDLAFKHFKQQESLKDHRTYINPNVTNMKKIADLYAEVIGVLSQSRFHSVRRRFFTEIRNADHSSTTIISIIEGMSFIRVKMFPVEELEQWFAFLQECARYFLDCPREKIKAAMSSLLVEILLPVAAVINLEASLPVAKKLVSMLYGHCTEHAKRVRYSNTYIPLATVLLAISEQSFFLNHWHTFLAQNILPSLKRGDSKIHNIALVSLYRLVWVYMIRIKGESNKTTMIRLRTVLDTLFPRGQRGVHPKEMPLNIFVKLIQFIAKERLEYAMQEVVLELLSQGKTKTGVYPERMMIGLRAFLVITDSLEKKEGDPPMPINPGPLPSKGLSRVKNRFLSSTLSEETAKSIGIIQFYPSVRRALDGILRSLDHQVGRQLTSTNPQPGKNVDEILSPVKPKLDLLRTCVAAIPRLLPENMNEEYLVDLLSRLTIHLDHELGRAAANSLHCMVNIYPSWRHSIVRVFVQFLLRDVPDSCPLILEAALKLLIQFVRDWRQLISSTDKLTAVEEEEKVKVTSPSCVPWVEACGLVALCSYRSVTRRLSLALLKEVRSLAETLSNGEVETAVMDVIDQTTPVIMKRYLSTLSVNQRAELRGTNQTLTLNWLADRAACFLEQGGSRTAMRDPWALCLAGLMEPSLLPKTCHSATRLAWPYLYHRMMKAYSVLDPGGLVSEKGDKPSSMRGKGRPIVSSVETFLWRNYCIFASCSAPPSLSLDSSSQENNGRPSPTARDLFQRVVPLIRWEGEIREVAVTALGLVYPPAFSDLVEQLGPVIHDALEQRRDVKRRRRREALKIQITRIFSLAAEHGCLQHSHIARTEHGHLSPVILDFIDSIRSHFETEKDGVHSYPELRLHFAGLISNIINGVDDGQHQMMLLSAPTRQALFYLFATWCGLWQRVDVEIFTRNHQISFNSLQAMSALLCAGPVFQSDGLDSNSLLYHWLDNMLKCKEGRVQTLGQKTVQLLLANNLNSPNLLAWVINRCYDNQVVVAQLCFQALASTLENFPSYPCDMVTVLHVVLYKTAENEHSIRERANQLLQVLDARFLSEASQSRPELLACLTGGTFSQSHVVFSKELATTNPELTFPLFSEMVYRFEMSPRTGQRNILQYMVPWLANMELVEETINSPYISHSSGFTSWPRPSSAVLQGSGWGSLDGTKLVLHNLLYITAKYGEEHTLEVERLWSALCSWQNNLRITINYLARLLCACGNMVVMVQHAKRVLVSFSRSHASAIITELIRDLQSVELISTDLQPSDFPPFYCMVGGGEERQREGHRGYGEGWTVRWRSAVRGKEGSPVALPVPHNKQYFASLKSMLKLPVRQLVHLHRCNFAMMMLSELVLELQGKVDWSEHLPLLLHVGILGLDLTRPLVCEHSKALLGNLVIVVACKENTQAALQTRLMQQEICLLPSSPYTSLDSVNCNTRKVLTSQGSSDLTEAAQDIIKFISHRECRRPRWPFADISSRSGDVQELSLLVEKIIKVFSFTGPPDLKEKWARKALNWATCSSSHQYASQSFQVCRALHLPLSPLLFREILTRLAESASDINEDMQSYVLEIVLTLESALDHLQLSDEPSVPMATTSISLSQMNSDPSPPEVSAGNETPLSPPSSSDSLRRHHRVRSITSTKDMIPHRPASAHVQILPLLVTSVPSGSQTSTGEESEEWKEEEEEEDGIEEEGEEKKEDSAEVKKFEPIDDEAKGKGRMKIAPLSIVQHLLPSTQSPTEHSHAYSDTTVLTSSGDTVTDSSLSSRVRKGSEPPPSLVALFERDTSKKTHKQHSFEEEALHAKQHSLDSSHLNTSPKHRRRMKSPILTGREMPRAPSHPQLHQTNSTPPHPPSVAKQPLAKASSIQQLRTATASPSDPEEGRGERSYSGGGEDMMRSHLSVKDKLSLPNTSRESLVSSNTSSVGSLKVRSEIEKEGVKEGRVLSKKMMSVGSVPMRSPARNNSDMWRRNSSQIGLRRDPLSVGRGGGIRPHSMVETSSFRPLYTMELNPSPSTLVAQMFWTAVSLLESDFESEFSMALRLITKCLQKMDLTQPQSLDGLQNLLPKFKWPNFPGVQAMLMKGLTLDAMAQDTRSLLALITPFSTNPVFDPSQYSGLPLNIMALMPPLVHCFNSPTPFCLQAVANIRQACEAVEMVSVDCKTKLQHMSRMFQMYSDGEFTTGCDIWLTGICRYLSEAYSSLSVQMLSLLQTMLEQGPVLYHRPVLRLLYEYLHLQQPLTHKIQIMVNSLMVVVHRHLSGPLWKEAVDVLKLVVASSAALVQPPTRGLPVDLGLFHHTLPGPTLQFNIDLQPNSRDLELGQELEVLSSWRNPAGSQRGTRERLLNVINACVPLPVLMSSPSVVFTDEQGLNEKGTIKSSASEEASSSLASVTGDLSSQPEPQNLITDEFNFLDNMEYFYDSSSESETPGPFSRAGEEREVGEEEEEEEEDEEDQESLSESETLPLELSMSELDQSTVLSQSPESSFPSISYDPPSLSSQLMALGQSGEALPEEEEEEEEEPEEQLPLAEGSPESHDVSLESHDTTIEECLLEKIETAGEEEENVKKEEEQKDQRGVSERDSSRESSNIPDAADHSQTVGRIQSEPPVDQVKDEMEYRGHSEPPLHISCTSVNQVREKRTSEGGASRLSEPPGLRRIEQVMEKDVRSGSVPSLTPRRESVGRTDQYEMEKESEKSLLTSEVAVETTEEMVWSEGDQETAVEGRHVSEPPVILQENVAMKRSVSEPPVHKPNEMTSEVIIPSSTGEEDDAIVSVEPTCIDRDMEDGKEEDDEECEEEKEGEVEEKGEEKEEGEVEWFEDDIKGEELQVEKDEEENRVNVEEENDLASLQPVRGTRAQFMLVPSETIVDVWKSHVSSFGSNKPEERAVHTHFLFARLFPVLRQQVSVLTREACSYLGQAYNTVAAHFLVTIELLGSKLQLPTVFMDSSLLVKTKSVESHIFLTLELDGNIQVYFERRITVLERLKYIKCRLREQSEEMTEESISLSPEQAMLQLCQAIHRLHFQLLVLLGSYIKLVHHLQSFLKSSGGVEISEELSEIQTSIKESVQLLGRVPSPLLEVVPASWSVSDSVKALEDLLTHRQWSQAVQLLRAVRRSTNREEEKFGNSEDDDVECLVYIYARFLTDNQEGVLCITSEDNELSVVHSELMAQNVSLHSLLETTHQTLSFHTIPL